MKHFVKAVATIAVIGTALSTAAIIFSATANAESKDENWEGPGAAEETKSKGLLGAFLPAQKPPSNSVVKTRKPRKSATKRIRKRKKYRRVRYKKSRKSRKVAKVAVPKTTSKEAKWWKSVGNPAVFAFRDCSANFAGQQAKSGVKSTPAELITTSMKTTCKVEFAKMAGVLIGGLGEKKSNVMLKELAETTFLPTVQTVLNSAQTVKVEPEKHIAVPEKVVEKVSDDQRIATAKADMFRCFSEKSDRLSAARSTPVNFIADSVLIGCHNKSDAFFDLLFANSKATGAEKRKQKNIALNETYRVAIVKRVLATRRNIQIKTATGVSQ